jgi:hypothetical protein
MRGYIAPLTEAAGEDEQRALSNIVSEMRFCASVPLTGVDMIQASSGTWNTQEYDTDILLTSPKLFTSIVFVI